MPFQRRPQRFSNSLPFLTLALSIVFALIATRGADAKPKKELAARMDASPKEAPKVEPMPPEDPTAKPAFDEAEKAIAHFKLMKPYQATVWAAEPQFMNPVAMSIDTRGRVWVVETHRYRGGGVLDIRNIYDWLDEDIGSRTVEDRNAMVKRHWSNWQELTKNSDRIRLLEDSSGGGRADHATLWADGFNDLADGIASGVLERKGTVYFTNIPNLWTLKDKEGKGVSTERKVLSTGYGTRFSFEGHDLHGLRFGPDGRLYFSCGDRGFNVTTKEGKKLVYPDTGGVLRCEPDGSNLEVFAYGLRNPQKLCFDDHGNLFTGDNNSDNGDPAKWFYVTEGADCGWRVGYQHIKSPHPTGVLLMENVMAKEKDSNQLYMTPPIDHICNGPSGCTFYPGTGMPDSFNGHFLLCDFKGGQTNSGIWTFTMKPKGASFEMPDRQQFIWQFLSTDCEFGTDGGVYATDWVNGWPRPNKGRIYRLFDAEAVKKPIVAEVKKLLADGMEKRPAEELALLLAHADQRVRQEAQFELADRGAASVQHLLGVMKTPAEGKSPFDASRKELARLHAIWGLGQIARKTPGAADGVVVALRDSDEQVRAQAAKVVGEARVAAGYDGLVTLLADPSLRVQFFAAQALGHLGNKAAIPALLQLAERNADKDAFVRHAVVTALAWLGDADAVLAAGGKSESGSVRLATALALRRLERPEVASFLGDADPRVVLEAARAINDTPIDAARPALAKLLANPKLDERVLRRALNANFREGKSENAAVVARFVGDASAPESVRVEALELAATWENPGPRDYVMGMPWPLDSAKRDAKAGEAALKPVLANVIKSSPEAVKVAALELAEETGLEPLDLAYEVFVDKQQPADVRTAALKVLGAHHSEKLADALKIGMVEKAPALRREAIRLQTHLPGAVEKLNAILADATPADQQAVFSALPLVGGDAADQILSTWLDKLPKGGVSAAAQLDLLEAAAKSKSKDVKAKLDAFEKAREAEAAKEFSLAGYRECLEGGDVSQGRKIFFEKVEVSCVRCHMVGKEGGGNVGPNLVDLGKRQNREYVLESILFPNAKIAPGFESAAVKLNDGRFLTGVVKDETAEGFKLDTGSDAGIVAIKKSEIKTRKPAPSPMPEDIAKPLSKQELRSLVEYLTSLKGEATAAGK